MAVVGVVGEAPYYSDGQSVTLDITATVITSQVAVISGWLGVTNGSGDSGTTIALDIGLVERQMIVPSTFDPSVGDIIYITIATITGHTPDDAAYTNTAGAGKIALGKVTVAKNDDDVLEYITLPNLAS